jgi:hypothetical protein
MAFTTLRDTETFLRNHRAPGPYSVHVADALGQAFLAAARQSTGSGKSKSMEDAQLACRKAVKAAKAYYRPGVPEALRHRGTYEWLATKPPAAERYWMRSLSLADEMGMRYESGMAHLEMGRCLRDLEHLSQAEAIFTVIGAEWDLTQTRRFLERFRA